MPTPKRQIHRTWIAAYGVLAVIFGVLALVPGIDAEGKVILGVLGGVVLFKAALEWIAMKRTSADEEVYTSLAEAPLDLQIRALNRFRWLMLVIAPAISGFTYWELRGFEAGKSPSVRIVMPFNWVYESFGKEAASLSMLACGLGIALLLHLNLRDLRRRATAPNESS